MRRLSLPSCWVFCWAAHRAIADQPCSQSSRRAGRLARLHLRRRWAGSMPDLESRTAATQATLAICGSVLLAFGGLALGLEFFGVAGAVAGFLLPPGVVAVFFATRQPPRLPPPVQKVVE